MQFIKVETRDHVTTITLNRPEAMNAINQAMHHELQGAFDAYAPTRSSMSAWSPAPVRGRSAPAVI